MPALPKPTLPPPLSRTAFPRPRDSDFVLPRSCGRATSGGAGRRRCEPMAGRMGGRSGRGRLGGARLGRRSGAGTSGGRSDGGRSGGRSGGGRFGGKSGGGRLGGGGHGNGGTSGGSGGRSDGDGGESGGKATSMWSTRPRSSAPPAVWSPAVAPSGQGTPAVLSSNGREYACGEHSWGMGEGTGGVGDGREGGKGRREETGSCVPKGSLGSMRAASAASVGSSVFTRGPCDGRLGSLSSC
jgi:hypothetical protein